MSNVKEPNSEEILRNIKGDIIRCLEGFGIKVKKMFLFGSRARGNFKLESDWDVLIVLNKDLTQPEKKELWSKVSKVLHKHFPYSSFDIIIKSTGSFEREKAVVNTISNEAYLEGVEI